MSGAVLRLPVERASGACHYSLPRAGKDAARARYLASGQRGRSSQRRHKLSTATLTFGMRMRDQMALDTHLKLTSVADLGLDSARPAARQCVSWRRSAALRPDRIESAAACNPRTNGRPRA